VKFLFDIVEKGLHFFLVHVLQELLRDKAAQMDESERRVIEQRLKDLGYI